MTSASTLALLCCLGMLMLLLVSPVASAASSTPPPSMRGSRLARLLTETQPGQLLTKSECNALPVDISASENSIGTAHCPGMMYYAPGFGYNNDQGICFFFVGSTSPASYADAQAICTGMDPGAVLWAPRDEAERCLATDLGGIEAHRFTGITDAQSEGEYVDQEGVAIPDVYLNWEQDNQLGPDNNCAIVGNANQMIPAPCDHSGTSGATLCVKRLPAS